MTTAQALPSWRLDYDDIRDARIQSDLADDLTSAQTFETKYKGKVATLDAKGLAAAITEREQLTARPRSPKLFAEMIKCRHQTDPEIGSFVSTVKQQINDIDTHLLFWEQELRKLDTEKLNGMYEQSPALAHYRPYLDKIKKFGPHTLGDDVEATLQKLQPAAAQTLLPRQYSEIMAKQRFPFPSHLLGRDGEGEKETSYLTLAEILSLRTSPDEAVRRAAYVSMRDTFKELSASAVSPASLMNHLMQTRLIDAEMRGYARPDSAANLANSVEDEVVDTLRATVKDNYSLNQRYLTIKAQLFGKEKLDSWDELAAAPTVSEKKISWEEAKRIALGSFEEFSPEMAAIAQRAFDEGWIDAAPAPDKRNGAFCSDTLDGNRVSGHPYILLNFMGRPEDVATLAHELGHLVHFMFSAKQGDLMNGLSVSFAETASTFAEMLVFKKLMATLENPAEKLALLEAKIGDALGTTLRQIAYDDFENKMYEERKKGELSAETFGKLWKESHAERTGDTLAHDLDNQGHVWANVHHFLLYQFYVNSYAFGDLLATSLYKNLFKVFLKAAILLFHTTGRQYDSDLSKRHQSRAV